MPEVITKHPDVVEQVLQSAGARCGTGEPQRILTKCPREQFCALPGGEICVYGVKDVAEMTQLSRAELCQGRTEAPQPPQGGPRAELGVAEALPAFAIVAGVLLIGRGR